MALTSQPKSKVLVIGALGYIGKYITIASVKLGHPTYVLLPSFHSADATENVTIQSFMKQGITFLKGDIYNHARMVQAISAVDVVISAGGFSNVMDQTRIIAAIIEAGNITRFIPSGFTFDPDRTQHVLQPAQNAIEKQCQMRRLIEQLGVPYTYIVANFFAGRLFGRLENEGSSQSLPLRIPLYGDGNTKVVFSVEEDIGVYTILAANDPRTLNKTLYIRPSENVITLNELVALWECKIERVLYSRNYVSEAALLRQYHDEEKPRMKSALALMHAFFFRGDQTNFVIDPSFGVETTQLYPHVRYTTLYEYLDRFLPVIKRGRKRRRNSF